MRGVKLRCSWCFAFWGNEKLIVRGQLDLKEVAPEWLSILSTCAKRSFACAVGPKRSCVGILSQTYDVNEDSRKRSTPGFALTLCFTTRSLTFCKKINVKCELHELIGRCMHESLRTTRTWFAARMSASFAFPPPWHSKTTSTGIDEFLKKARCCTGQSAIGGDSKR